MWKTEQSPEKNSHLRVGACLTLPDTILPILFPPPTSVQTLESNVETDNRSRGALRVFLSFNTITADLLSYSQISPLCPLN